MLTEIDVKSKQLKMFVDVVDEIKNVAVTDPSKCYWLFKAILASRSRVFQKMLYQAPSPQQRKKEKDQPQRETNKLRLFLKRSSEPLLNLQNAAQQVKKLLKVKGVE